MKTRQSILGLLAFAAIMVVAGAAYAACKGSNRVIFNNAECLHGWWDNNDWPQKKHIRSSGFLQELGYGGCQN